MNPGLLRSFLAVSRHLNFTRAADELALTQPAVSRQVGQLERDLGVILFERLGRSVYLTDSGRRLIPLAEQLLGQMDRVVEAMRGDAHAGLSSLRIGASTTPGYYLLPPVLGQFHRAHPDVELQFRVENSMAIERRIMRNELDLGFIGAPVVNEPLASEPIAEDEIVCFCGARPSEGTRRRWTPRALTDATWIVREHGSATRRLFEQRLAAVGVKMRRLIELGSPEGIKALVLAGVGISFMSIRGIEPELRDGELKRIEVRGLKLTRPLLLVRHPDKHISPAMRAFTNLLSAVPQTVNG